MAEGLPGRGPEMSKVREGKADSGYKVKTEALSRNQRRRWMNKNGA